MGWIGRTLRGPYWDTVPTEPLEAEAAQRRAAPLTLVGVLWAVVDVVWAVRAAERDAHVWEFALLAASTLIQVGLFVRRYRRNGAALRHRRL